MSKSSPFKTLDSRIAYQNPWIKVREDTVIRPDGSEGIYGVVESKDSVILVVANDKNEIGFINIFRYPIGEWKWELPGGGGEGQDIIEASKRELHEEMGISAKNMHILSRTRVCNGLMTEYQTNVLAADLTFSKATDDEEGIEGYKFIPFDQVEQMIGSGEIDDGQSITALYFYKNWLSEN